MNVTLSPAERTSLDQRRRAAGVTVRDLASAAHVDYMTAWRLLSAPRLTDLEVRRLVDAVAAAESSRATAVARVA